MYVEIEFCFACEKSLTLSTRCANISRQRMFELRRSTQVAQGAPLLREQTGSNWCAGSNPAFSAKMNPTEPVKRLKFGFIFLCKKYGFESQAHSKRDLNPHCYLLYDLKLSIGSMFRLQPFYLYSQVPVKCHLQLTIVFYLNLTV